MDVAGIVHENLHFIKLKKLSAMILKLDLKKEYDKVDCYFLYLVLVRIGLPLNVSQWILSCVNSTPFVVLIHGS